MPTYVYKCANCGKVVELYQPYNLEERIEPVCSECHGDELQRVYSKVSVHFRGDGWYSSDKNKAAL